jgi:hypothetical protein
MGFQTLTVKYDSIQERIVVIVRVPGVDYALLLTRRFTCGLLSLLARQVQNTPARPKKGWSPESSATLPPPVSSEEENGIDHVCFLSPPIT